MKKIAVGDLGEFWYGDYKEPFEQLEGGVPGHPVGVVLKDDDGKVLCAYCGKTFELLGRHVREKHGLTAKEYKAEVGLLASSSLVSERLRICRVAQGKRRVATPALRAKALETLERARANHVYNHSNGLRSAEKLNMTGRCYQQLLVVGASILREDGRISERTLRKRGVSEKSVLAFWDSLDDYRRAVGDPYRTQNRRWSEQQLTAALRSLAMKLGRTPSESDMRRFGLPYATTYIRRFGSWAEACRRANLDPNLPVVVDTEVEVRLFAAYATTGQLKSAAQIAGIGQNRAGELFQRYGAPFVQRSGGVMRVTGTNTSERKAWAAEMARRLAGVTEQAAA